MSCCHNCTKRTATCHSRCKEYKEEAMRNAERRDAENKERAVSIGIYEHVRRTAERYKRHKRNK